MPWWEELLDFVGLSRQRINAFVIVVGVVAIVVFAALYRGTGMIAAIAAVAIGIALAVMSLVLRAQKVPSWILCLAGIVVAALGTVLSVKLLGIYHKGS
ncbi:MAG TPA: hypothetical protein VG317_18240 [Pseudonocardiaceae bacterium]|jgi:hypothetical protein|nr:hypothetical protein [Pseudonocardiaceae bacterium]